jgi:hypothetical protein
MTQDETIEMVRQAGGQVTAWVNQSTIQKTTTFTFESPIDYYVSGEYPEKYHIKFLEALVKLAAAKEREACAKIFDDAKGTGKIASCREAAIAIRARGEQA